MTSLEKSNLNQDKPIRKHCCECGKTINSEVDNFFNFEITAMNGTAQYTVCNKGCRGRP